MVKVPCAEDTQSKAIVFAVNAERKRKYTCLECARDVVVHRGPKRVSHFAHLSDTRHCNGGGESAIHRSTKEWVKSIVGSPQFAVRGTCTACGEHFTVFQGSPAHTGVAECRAGKYVVDVAVFRDGKIAAFLEVFYSHQTLEEKRKMLEATAGWPCPVAEIKAVNLVEQAYPTEFECISPRRCKKCLRAAVERRGAAMHARYACFFREGLQRLRARRHAIAERVARRWLFMVRVRRVGQRLKELGFAKCAVCKAAVKRPDAAAALHHTRRRLEDKVHFLRIKDEESVCSVKCLQTRCAKVCLECLEERTRGKWCACRRKRMAKCLVCKRWKEKKTMAILLPIPGHPERMVRACTSEECTVTCMQCSAKFPYNEKYPRSTRCFRCNYRNKHGEAWSPMDDGFADGTCKECGVYVKSTRYDSTCYACNHY